MNRPTISLARSGTLLTVHNLYGPFGAIFAQL
jgi:hypothetical protein